MWSFFRNLNGDPRPYHHQGDCMNHFLAISDLSSGEVQDLLDLAIKLKEEYFKKGTPEDTMYGRMYRRIAKDLLERLLHHHP